MHGSESVNLDSGDTIGTESDTNGDQCVRVQLMMALTTLTHMKKHKLYSYPLYQSLRLLTAAVSPQPSRRSLPVWQCPTCSVLSQGWVLSPSRNGRVQIFDQWMFLLSVLYWAAHLLLPPPWSLLMRHKVVIDLGFDLSLGFCTLWFPYPLQVGLQTITFILKSCPAHKKMETEYWLVLSLCKNFTQKCLVIIMIYCLYLS